ncbi:MAG: regulatory signaling modulator protein AmpE, partial [Gammaproteobacteria bacterium]|nr:regulatory signaling modulator protein AmpE [Gammaproteobacteria bacterium]
PVVGFGLLGARVERILFHGTEHSTRICGVVGWVAMVLPVLVIVLLLLHLEGVFYLLAEVIGLYLVVAGRGLALHAKAVEQALSRGDPIGAHERVEWMVGEEREPLDAQQLTSVTIESVLDKGNRSLFAALFWFIVAGLPGALLFRAANILDQMWGYKSDRYYQFGWFTTHVNGWMNAIPARLTALSYLLIGSSGCAWRCWRKQMREKRSLNDGVVVAAGAGALQIELGGTTRYPEGLNEQGCRRQLFTHDIDRSVALVEHSLLLWIGVLWGVGFLFNG